MLSRDALFYSLFGACQQVVKIFLTFCFNFLVNDVNLQESVRSISMSTAKSKPFNYEKALNELEKVVEQMESGDQSLENSLKNFEKGIKLTRECQAALKAAEQKVQILIEENGQAFLEELDEDEDEDF